MKVEVPAFERYLASVRQIGVQRPMRADWACYERMKAEFVAAFPGATPSEYQRAMREIAKGLGI